MDEFSTHGRASTQERSQRAFGSFAFDPIRNQPILESTPEDFLKLMKGRGPALVHYLRRLHNLALNLGWLSWPVLHKAAWPKPQQGTPRAITEAEYRLSLKVEGNENAANSTKCFGKPVPLKRTPQNFLQRISIGRR